MKDKVLIANLGSMRYMPPRLKRYIKHHKPLVVVITEAYHLRNGVDGYDFFKSNDSAYDDTVGTMVRAGERRWQGLMRMRHNWTFRAGERKPRAYHRIRTTKETNLRVLGVHFEPFGPYGKNGEAWHHSLLRTTDYLDCGREMEVPSIAMGDFNTTADLLRHRTSYRVAQASKVNHFLHYGLKNVSVKKLRIPFKAKREGCHGWAVMTFETR